MAALDELVDPRICPPEALVDASALGLFEREQVRVQYTHGIIGRFVQAPESVRQFLGVQMLGEWEESTEFAQTQIDGDTRAIASWEQVGAEPEMVNRVKNELSERDYPPRGTLMTRLDKLAEDNKWRAMVPAIVRTYLSNQLGYKADGKLYEDNGMLYGLKVQTIRRGLAYHFRAALLMSLTQDIGEADEPHGFSYPVELTLAEQEKPVSAQLLGIDVDPDGRAVLVVTNSPEQKEIPLAGVKKVGFTIV